jgi:TrmH family RNA methyltransferase
VISKNKLKYYSSLKRKKNREREHRFLIEGVRLCEEIFASDFEVETLLYCPALLISQRSKDVIAKFQQRGTPVLEIDVKSLQQLSDTVHSQGVVGVAKMHDFSWEQIIEHRPHILLAIDQITDPGNMGTIIRTANWFGAAAILLSENCVDVANPKVVRASMGALFYIPIFEIINFKERLHELKKMGYALFAADPVGELIYSTAPFTTKNVLILGNETTGVDAEIKMMANARLVIPRQGTGDSLNVAVAAGILLAEMKRNMPV